LFLCLIKQHTIKTYLLVNFVN